MAEWHSCAGQESVAVVEVHSMPVGGVTVVVLAAVVEVEMLEVVADIVVLGKDDIACFGLAVQAAGGTFLVKGLIAGLDRHSSSPPQPQQAATRRLLASLRMCVRVDSDLGIAEMIA